MKSFRPDLKDFDPSAENETGMDELDLEIAGDMLRETEEVVTAAAHLADGGAVADNPGLAPRIEEIRARLDTTRRERDASHMRCLDASEAEALADAAGLVLQASREHGRLWRMAGRVLSLASGAESPA